MNWRCRIGIHHWWMEDNNYTTPTEVVMRTYERCTRCLKWGRLYVFSKYDVLTNKVIERKL